MKKHHWHAFWHKKLFEKHLQPHFQTRMGPRLVSPAHLRGSNNFFRREKKKVGHRIDERQVLPVMHINFMKASLLRIIQAHE